MGVLLFTAKAIALNVLLKVNEFSDGTCFIAAIRKTIKVYDPITFGFIHRNGVFGIR